MADQVGICNLALSFLGDTANLSSLSERSPQAQMCSVFYPNAKIAMLEMHDWSFATRRKLLPRLANEDGFGWRYVHEAPADCLRIIRLRPYDAEVADCPSFGYRYAACGVPSDLKFEVLGRNVYSNGEKVVATYVTSQVSEGYFSPLFTTAFAYYLALELAGARIKGKEGQMLAQELTKQFQLALSVAKTRDANQQRKTIEFVPPWLRVR